MSYVSQIGGGTCSLCNSPGTNKTNCPLNPGAKNPNRKNHPLASGVSPSPRSKQPSQKITERSFLAKKNSYLVHNNSGRPYGVVVNDSDPLHLSVDVYDRYSNFKHVTNIKALRVMIGLDRASGLSQAKSRGNTILLQVPSKKGNKYVIIGGSSLIRTFNTDQQVTRYESPIGNSDVPYPYAITKDWIYIIMSEGVRIPKTEALVAAIEKDQEISVTWHVNGTPFKISELKIAGFVPQVY
jgi:hypothetical protein